MSMKKSVVCLALASVCAASMFTACGRGGGDKIEIDTDRTQIYIGLGTNGIKEWADTAAKRFEEKYANVSFEEGKMGVQVVVPKFDEKFQNFDTLPLNHSKYTEKFLITESIPYARIKNMALDITDTVTSPISLNPVTGVDDGTESVSIEDKMFKQFKDYYGADGHYYAIPAQEATMGIVYDVDLFDELGLYFANDESENVWEFETSKNAFTGEAATYRFVDSMLEWTKDDLSAGPDGQKGTYDDGMPATYEEFFALCEFMKLEYGIEPIRWSGKVQAYMTDLLNSLAADFEGDEYLLMSSFDGTDTNLVEFDADGKMKFDENGLPVTVSKEINNENGYSLVNQEGYYHALRFLEALIKSDYYDKDLCWQGTEQHMTTQSKYLLSKQDTKAKTIAMLVEGSWWQGEASATFTDMAARYGEQWSVKNRNFGYMPLPKMSEAQVGNKQNTTQIIEFTCFISNSVNEELIPVYKLFMKEMFSREGLYEFTSVTGQMRPYSIDLTQAEQDALTGFGRSNYNLHTYTNIRFKPSYNPVFIQGAGLFTATANFHWQSNLGSVPTEMIRDGNSPAKIFEEINKYWTQEKWDGYFKGTVYGK